VGEENLKVYITEFYKKLFRAPITKIFALDKSNNHDIPQLSNEENEILVADFTEQEVHDAIFQMEKNKAPGPDVFPTEFYQKLWDVIKNELMALFRDFQEGSLPLFQLNFWNNNFTP
jgi:mannosylglycoprotein endo-beta-mannosidase